MLDQSLTRSTLSTLIGASQIMYLNQLMGKNVLKFVQALVVTTLGEEWIVQILYLTFVKLT